MEINDELKEIDVKNRRCYYFDDIIKIEDFDFDVWKYFDLWHFIQNFDWCKTIAH